MHTNLHKLAKVEVKVPQALKLSVLFLLKEYGQGNRRGFWAERIRYNLINPKMFEVKWSDYESFAPAKIDEWVGPAQHHHLNAEDFSSSMIEVING